MRQQTNAIPLRANAGERWAFKSMQFLNRSRAFQAAFAAALNVLTPTSALADETVLCIRGKSFESGREFLQTRQLKLQVVGPPLSDQLIQVASRAAREKLWPGLKQDEVQVVTFDARICGNDPIAEVSIQVSPSDLITIRAESNRGPGEQARLNAIASRAKATPAPARRPPAGTELKARRHDWVHLYFATNRQLTGTRQSQNSP